MGYRYIDDEAIGRATDGFIPSTPSGTLVNAGVATSNAYRPFHIYASIVGS